MYLLAHFVVLVSLFSPDAPPDQTGRIAGRALSAYNGKPLAGVIVSLPAIERSVVTDSAGTFVIRDLPVGHQSIRVTYDGRETADYVFRLREGRTIRLAIVLDATVNDLAPIVVEAGIIDLWRDLAGFYERRRQYKGYARFYTREDIERQQAGRIST
ncbi:MAG TPA: carboxypeptidase regulatory-like domain-containing protein, partial [Gemmatimonadales bacterium]|nr:carboxypeptidase regulatory-like domain-containing protein [Gemmatimonadales bacterium]